MINTTERTDCQLGELREFSPEIPDAEAIERIAESTYNNRDTILACAEKWGLNPDLLSNNVPIIVSPFFSPGPIPTSFGGDPHLLRNATRIGSEITEAIR